MTRETLSVTNKPLPTTTLYAVSRIAQRTEVSAELVRRVLDEFTNVMVECLEEEIPFQITGLGKLYFTYRNGTNLMQRVKAKAFFADKVHRELRFTVASGVKGRLQGWVHDLGLKNNIDRKEMMRLKIKPDEIAKTRRARVLEDQRAMGFRPELLFDEADVPDADKAAAATLAEAPSVEEMLERLGVNIDLNK